ncbi:MAG: cell division protein SepF [Eggerthellaceae bacterium]|nr:cell division protein SepF [Eggerthellaceae bacterium]
MAFLDDIKERLGFGEADEEEFDEELYGDDFDEYSEEFESDYAHDAADDDYAAFEPAAVPSSRRRNRGSSRRASRASGDSPQLVSMDDVRNSTRVPESLQRDPLPPRRGDNGGRNSVGRASDFSRSGSETMGASATYASETPASRSEGYNSLFDSSNESSSFSKPASEVGMGTHPAQAGGYDPYRVYEAGSTSSHRPTRSISVISPIAYNEVENVARMLRAGDAVVLSLRNTPNQLSKRILDFSFGVASALDATVDCIADKVFAITRVSNLDEDELSRLRNQGVI